MSKPSDNTPKEENNKNNNDIETKKESVLDTLKGEPNSNTTVNNPNPPKLHYENQTNLELDPKPKIDKKPHEMNDYEMAMHIARNKEFKFLMVDDDGNYYEKILNRKAIKDKMREAIIEVRDLYLNWRNLPKKFNSNKEDRYYNNSYYEVHGKRFYLQQDMYDYYLKLIIHYCFKVPIDGFNDFATDDDPEEMDNNNRFCYKTIAKVCMEIGNVGLSFFPKA